MSIRTRKAAKDAQTLANVNARYDAAGTGRRMKGWTPPSTGPRRAVEGLQRIRDRSNDAARNDWAAASTAQKWTTTLVGVGITPRWAKDRFTEVWTDFVPQADADGVLDAYGMQALGVRSWMVAGEVFMRRRWRDVASPLALPVQAQLIESDYCPIFDADTWPNMPAGNTIRQGIERNKYGRRVAYWMYREHPGDGMRGLNISNADLLRIPASDISHVFNPLRPGQLRGVSDLAPVLARLRASGDFEDVVLDRQKLANLYTVFFKKPLPSDWQNLKVDPNTGLPMEWDRKDQPMAGLEPGIAMDLLPGEEVVFSNPPEAGVSFADYIRTLGLGTAAGGGLPYEIMSGDIREVSDRALRVLIQEFRRYASQRQWHLVIPRLAQPMVDWAGDAAALNGRLRVSERVAFGKPEWSPHGWDYIHPVQDVQGKKLAIEAGITSQSAVIAETGNDPRKVLAQRAEDQKANEAAGLPAPGVAAPVAGAPGAKPATEPAASATAIEKTLTGLSAQMLAMREDRGAVPPAIEQVFAGLMGLMTAQSAQQAATAQMLDRIVQAQQDSNAALHTLALALAQRPIEQHTHVDPPDVTVNNQVPPGETVVNVAAPAVTVPVTVQPAEVQNHLHMPDRESETQVTTDDEGNLVRSVTRERTVQ
jgi:lambda family phage portal protein